MKHKPPHTIETVSEMHTYLGLPKPMHPLVSFHRFEQINFRNEKGYELYNTQFYSIAVKKNFKGKIRYGQSFYDFDEGMMSFIGPGQLLGPAVGTMVPTEGYCLLFHPEFLNGYPLTADIKDFNFFSYELNEALHLSEQEEKLIESLMLQIECEYKTSIDTLSQDVMISYITLLLQYCQRFYNRQFVTRKPANNDMLSKLDRLLDEYLDNGTASNEGLPHVKYFAELLNVSAGYLSDMLRATTGVSTQIHIQNKLIEKTKQLLSGTDLSVSEVAYQLGFERPQSLSKFFKSKTNLSPSDYRNSLN